MRRKKVFFAFSYTLFSNNYFIIAICGGDQYTYIESPNEPLSRISKRLFNKYILALKQMRRCKALCRKHILTFFT